MTVSVPIPGPLRPTTLVGRPNRLSLRVETDLQQETLDAHLVDPLGLDDLLLPGSRVWVRDDPGASRRPRWRAALAATADGTLVSLDRSLAPALVIAALRAGALEELAGFDLVDVDVPRGRSRLDLELKDIAGNRVLVQVEAVPGGKDGRAWAPESRSERATRSLRTLIETTDEPGLGAALVLIAPRADVAEIVPDPSVDPDFAAALADAATSGVRVVGRRCPPTLEELVLGIPIPVRTRG